MKWKQGVVLVLAWALGGVTDALSQDQDLMAPRPVDASKIVFKPGSGLQVGSEDGQFSMTTRQDGPNFKWLTERRKFGL